MASPALPIKRRCLPEFFLHFFLFCSSSLKRISFDLARGEGVTLWHFRVQLLCKCCFSSSALGAPLPFGGLLKTKHSYKFIEWGNNQAKNKIIPNVAGHCCCHLFVVIIYKQFKQSVCSQGFSFIPSTYIYFFLS